MPALRCIFGIFLWLLTRYVFQGIGTEQWIPFVPAMKLCLGGVSTVEAEEAELATKTPLGWDCRRRARVGRAGVLKLNGELER